MDPQKLKDAYQRLEALDERLTYKIRPYSGGTMIRPSTEQLEERLKDVVAYTLELKEVVRDFLLAFAKRPAAPAADLASGGTGGVPPLADDELR